jgi:putative membrane protein
MAAALVITAFVYVRGWLRLRRWAPETVSRWRLWAFLGGLVAVSAAVSPPLAALHHELLTVHMVQHLLLSTVAAPLLLVGTPALPLRFGIPRSLMPVGWGWLLRSRAARGVFRALGHPALCWIVAMAVFMAWHTPALFQLALGAARWRTVEDATFLASGLLFWWPVVQPWPSVARWPRWSVPWYLFLATLPCDGLSAFLALSDRVVYPAYLEMPRHRSLSVLEDQACAGAIMWLWVTIAYVIPAAVIMTDVVSRAAPPTAHDGERRDR